MTGFEQKHWAKKKERGSSAGIMFMLYTFKFLGAGICKLFMSPVLLYFYCFNRSARWALYDFLKKVKQQNPSSPTPNQWQVLKIFFNFGFGIVDRMSAWQGNLNKFKLTKENSEVFLDLVQAKQGGIIMVSHVGNFEISKMAAQDHDGVVFNVFMHTKNAQKFSQAIKKFNPDFELSIIQGDGLNIQTAMALKEKVDHGEFVVIAGDRIPVDNESAVVTANFLGHQAEFPIGPYVLAKVLGCPLIGLFCSRSEQGYHVIFESYAKQLTFNKSNRQEVLEACAQQYADSLTRQVNKTPLQWYNFHQFWKHHD